MSYRTESGSDRSRLARTCSGIAFTIVFCTIFFGSEKIDERRHAEEIHTTSAMDQFRLNANQAISNETVEARPGKTLCLVRDYNTLGHGAA